MSNKFVFRFLGVVLFVFVFSLQSFAQTVKFVQISDIHYSPAGTTGSNRDVSQSANNLQFAVQSINRQDVNFVMFLGDNIDQSSPSNLLSFMRCVQKVNKPFYFVIGNHDAYKLSGIPKDDYIKVARLYNPYQKSNLPYYYFYPTKGVIAIVVDGASSFAPTAHGLYTKEMTDWLDKVLAKNTDKVALIFQHFPLIAPTDNYSHATLESDRYMELLYKYKNIASISSGHFHADKVTIDENGIYHISVPSLLSQPSTYEVVTVDYKKKRCQKTPSDIKIDINRIQI